MGGLNLLISCGVVVVVWAHAVLGQQEDFLLWVRQSPYLYPTLPIAAPFAEDEICRGDSHRLISDLKNGTLWAVQMWDSSVRAPEGVLDGNTMQFGHFDECLRVVAPVEAQFCLVQVSAAYSLPPSLHLDPYALDPNPHSNVWQKIEDSRIDPSKITRSKLTLGLCVPASCSRDTMQTTINTYLDTINSTQVSYRAQIPPGYCINSQQHPDYSLSEILFWSTSVFIIALAISCTIVDFIPKHDDIHKDTKLMRLCMSFSLKRNVEKLLRPEDSTTNDPLGVFHVFKVISLFVIFMGHRTGIFLGLSAFNYQAVEEEVRQWRNNLTMVHGDLMVDTFFFISGVLACYFMCGVYTKRFINPLTVVVARVARLAPLYFFIIWFQTYPVLRFGSGPIWSIIGKEESKVCLENWWSNLLFFNNYVPADKMCMIHSWYIACDLHAFLITIPLVILLTKKRTLGVGLLSGVTITSVLVPGVVTYLGQYKPLVLFYNDFFANPRGDVTFDLLYRQTHNRIAVYLLGAAVGYFLHRTKNSTKQISKVLMWGGIVLWLVLTLTPMIYGSRYYNPSRSYDVIESAIFASLRRVLWGLGLAVFIITHRFRRIPIFTGLGSCRVVVVLSRLTYAIYLVHFNLLMVQMQNTKTATPFTLYEYVVSTAGYYMSTVLYAAALHLLIEQPCKHICQLIFTTSKHSVPTPQDTQLNQIDIIKL